jgi:hypothetical protein
VVTERSTPGILRECPPDRLKNCWSSKKCQLTKTQRIQVTFVYKILCVPLSLGQGSPPSTAVLYPLIQGTDVRVLQFISIVSSNLSVLTLRDPGPAPRSPSDTPDGGLIGFFGGAPNQIEQRGRKSSTAAGCSRSKKEISVSFNLRLL